MNNYMTLNFRNENHSLYSSDKGVNLLPYVYNIVSYFSHSVDNDISVEVMNLELSKFRVIVKDVLIPERSFLFEFAYRDQVQIYTNMPISYLGSILTRFKFGKDEIEIYLDEAHCLSNFNEVDFEYVEKVQNAFNNKDRTYDDIEHPNLIRGQV